MFPKDTKILVVDDMSTMRKLVSKHLSALGYENVTKADDGAVAWPEIEKAHAAGKPFDLIISDWNMPQMPGIDLLKKVRSDIKLKDTPFLLVTAESEKEQVMGALQAGVSNYIVKPFTADMVREKLQDVYKKIANP